MFGKFARAMAGHDLLHDLLLHKPPCPIARGALLIRKQLFNGVVIQRGRSHVAQFRRSTIYARDFRSITSTRRAKMRDACALICLIRGDPRLETSISMWAIRRVSGSADCSYYFTDNRFEFLRVKRDFSIEHRFNYCPYENPGRLWNSNRQP